jgi:calcineurin-like phosphoesterase family protein
MKTWITSDLHFGHDRIRQFCPETRGRFTDVTHMNETMIREWNTSVQPEDLVYILGDVAFLPAAQAVSILKRLNGSKILVSGNHDRKLLNDPVFRSCFQEIHNYLCITHNSTRVVMFHFPILEWDQMHRGAVHFYGHVHGNKTGLEPYRARDVAFDATGSVVSNFDHMIQEALKGQIKSHH